MKIIEKNGKHKENLKLMDVVKASEEYFMVINADDVYRYLDLQTGLVSGMSYSSLEDMEEDNLNDLVVEAELHIK